MSLTALEWGLRAPITPRFGGNLEALPRLQETRPKQQKKTDLKHKTSDRSFVGSLPQKGGADFSRFFGRLLAREPEEIGLVRVEGFAAAPENLPHQRVHLLLQQCVIFFQCGDPFVALGELLQKPFYGWSCHRVLAQQEPCLNLSFLSLS